MSTRAEIMNRLSALPTQELLHLLRDETIFEIASKYFESMAACQVPVGDIIYPQTEHELVQMASKPVLQTDRAKRPLNAFMAFRSYYVKLFPDVQQKTASGFLTTLWNKDPFRNKWALIAKVYSFVRDDIGRSRVSLSDFLSLACPVMGVIEPAEYLSSLGWSVEELENNMQKLSQDENSATTPSSRCLSVQFPSSEVELLTTLVSLGYLPDEGYDVIQRMSLNKRSMMATTGKKRDFSVSPTKEKIDFINDVNSDPAQASNEAIGRYHNHLSTSQGLEAQVHEVKDLYLLDHLPIQQTARPEPPRYYNYATSHAHIGFTGAPVLSFTQLPPDSTFDISSPWDLDLILGQTQQEGERTLDLRGTLPAHDSREDFQYMF